MSARGGELDMAGPRSPSLSSTAVRIACEATEAHGTPWQAIINGLRPLLQDIWRGLEVQELATP